MDKLSWNNLPRPIVALSPMADMTDSAFCRTVRDVMSTSPETANPDALIVFREMVSAEAVVRGNDKTLGMTDIHDAERPIVQQIFGSDPNTMAEAVRIIDEKHSPEGFDINMGCPVYKMVHSFNGAALMQEPERAASIVRAMKAATEKPVSVKIRAGWGDPEECMTFGTVLEDAGADMITIHGRTKMQGYSGQSDWNRIREFKKTVSIPVLANGDIFTPQLAREALDQTACDGVLIARGALGNPWIFKQIQQHLLRLPSSPVTLDERIRVLKAHARLHVEQYGPKGVMTFRKHLTWYFKGIPGAKPFKERLHTVSSLEELDEVLDLMLKDGLERGALSRRDAEHPLASVRMYLAK